MLQIRETRREERGGRTGGKGREKEGNLLLRRGRRGGQGGKGRGAPKPKTKLRP